MKKVKKDKHFIKSAYYEGGRSAMAAYVKKELRYPKEALAAKIEGTVSVQYTVDYKGNVTETHIISGIGHGCDEEALRLVKSLKFKVPQDGKIKSKYSRKLHIHFKLASTPAQSPAKPPATGGMQVQYQITSSENKTTTPDKPKSTSYQISFTIPAKPKKE